MSEPAFILFFRLLFYFLFVNYILAYNDFCVNSFFEKKLLIIKIFFLTFWTLFMQLAEKVSLYFRFHILKRSAHF